MSTPAPTTGPLTALVTQLLAVNDSLHHGAAHAYPQPMDPKERSSYLREFRTVGLMSVRQSGKTRVIKELIGPEDLVIFRNADILKAFWSWCESVNEERPPSQQIRRTNLLSFHQVQRLVKADTVDSHFDAEPSGVKMRFIRRVFVDDSTFIFDEQLDRKRFYRWLAHNSVGPIEILMIN